MANRRTLRNLAVTGFLASALSFGYASPSLPGGTCKMEDRGNGVYELKTGTMSPKSEPYSKEFSGILEGLGYSDDDPRVVFISGNGIGKGYAITPDLVLTVNHVAGATRSIHTKKVDSVRINPYAKEIAMGTGDATDGTVRSLRDAFRNGSTATGPLATNSYDNFTEGLTYLSFEIGYETPGPFTTGKPVATVQGMDIALIRLESPLPNIKGTALFRGQYGKGEEEVTIRRTPSRKLFIKGVVDDSGRVDAGNFFSDDEVTLDTAWKIVPSDGTSGSAITDVNGRILGAVHGRHVNTVDTHTVHAAYSSGAPPSDIIGMVREYCDGARGDNRDGTGNIQEASNK